MEKKIVDFIKIKNFIPKNVCSEVIKIIEEKENWKQHAWYSSVTYSHTFEEDKELDILFHAKDAQNLLEEYIIEAANHYLDECSFSISEKTLHVIYKFSDIRFNRYTQNTMMRPHHDHIHSLFDGFEKGIPVLSLVGILNDDYEGGKFVFYDDYEIETKVGDILLFPSCFLYPHRVTEITSGCRYSFVCWGW